MPTLIRYPPMGLLALVPAVLTGCPADDDTPRPSLPPAATTGYEPSLDTVPCRFALPEGVKEGAGVSCGDVIVPADRQNKGDGTIRVHFVHFVHFVRFVRQSQEGRQEPLIFLTGGPGQPAAGIISTLMSDDTFKLNRDIVFVDQRGIGTSQPRLECEQETSQLSNFSSEDLSENQAYDRAIEVYLRYPKRHQDAGVNLRAFNNQENAADIEDLRKVLGYQTMVLWGTSYGGRLALEIIRRYPTSVRAAVLDSPQSPGLNPIKTPRLHLDAAITAVS